MELMWIVYRMAAMATKDEKVLTPRMMRIYFYSWSAAINKLNGD